jgi:hypothetical protein
MSADLLEQLRSLAQHYDDVAEPVTVDELRPGSPAVTPPSSGVPVRVLAIAASLTLLAGAVWMFSRDASEQPSTVVPATTTVAPTTDELSSTVPSTVDAQNATWFTLQLDGYRPGSMSTQPCCIAFPPPGPPTVAAWSITSNGSAGFLLLRRFPVLSNEQFVHTQSLFLNQPDGSAWMFDGVGLTDQERDQFARQVTQQPDGSFVLDPSGSDLAPLAIGTANAGQLRAQVYSSPRGGVTLTVGTYRGEFNRFTGGGPMRSVTVAGLPGYATSTDRPSSFVVWQMGSDLWGTLEAPVATDAELDELIAALTPAVEPTTSSTPLLHPELPEQVRAVATVIEGRDGTPMLAWTVRESLPPQGGDIPLVGWNWDDVDGEQTAAGVTWGGLYEVIGTWDGTTFRLTQPPIAATPTTPEAFAFITPGCDELSFAPERQQLEAAALSIDPLFNVNVNQINGHCGLTIVAMADTAALSAVLADHADHIDSVTYLLTPVD